MIPYHIRLMYLEHAFKRKIGSMLFYVTGNFVFPHFVINGKDINPLKLSLEIREMEDYRSFIEKYLKK